MNANRTTITALALLALFTCARAASAETYVDAKSGVTAFLPEGFYGTSDRSPDEQLVMKRDDIEARISVAAMPLLTEREFKILVEAMSEKDVPAGTVTNQIYAFRDGHRVAYVPSTKGRFYVLVTRPQGLAIGGFVGGQATDAHVAVVDAVAQSISVQKTTKVAFSFPQEFEQVPASDGAFVVRDPATARYIVMADDDSTANASFAQQAQEMLSKGMLGSGRPSVYPSSVRSPVTGVGFVDVSYVTKSGDAMAGVMARVNLPARPVWLVVVGPGHEPGAQQALLNEVVSSMLKETVVASR